MAGIPVFVKFEKAYPYYNAYTIDGKKAYIKVNGESDIQVYGVSNRPVQITGPYSNAFNANRTMEALMWVGSRPTEKRYWNYYLYVDSCTNAGIKPWHNSIFFSTDLIYDTKVSKLVKLTKKYPNGMTAGQVNEEILIPQLKAIGYTTEAAKFLIKEKRNFDGGFAYSYLKKYPSFCEQVMEWFASPAGQIISRYDMRSYINKYCRLITELKQSPECGDLWELIIKAQKAVDRLNEVTFKTAQLKHKLVYPNPTFEIIVPTTRDELQAEGDALHNCLNEHAWHFSLKNGDRQVVFIRRKENRKKPYIACDIDAKTGQICQYLTYCNQKIQEEDAKQFKNEYQEYLYSIYTAQKMGE